MANSASSSGQKAAISANEAESRAKILEGVDFIETEEDAEAVESAVVKIQSTFRGKKIRSKLSQKPTETSKANEQVEKLSSSKGGEDRGIGESSVDKEKKSTSLADSKRLEADDEELNKKVSSMQVNDNNEKQAANTAANSVPAEEEAERAATKIQAGFKGYKTRKELENKLSGQQAALAADSSQEPTDLKAD